MTTSNVDTARARRWAEPDEDGEDTMLDLERMKIMHALADEVDRLRAERALLVRVEEASRKMEKAALAMSVDRRLALRLTDDEVDLCTALAALDAHREAHRE